MRMRGKGHTRGQTLLELLRLLGVIQRERVEVTGAPNLELGLGLAAGNARRNLLDARGCEEEGDGLRREYKRREWNTHTLGVLAARNVDELLDVTDLLRLPETVDQSAGGETIGRKRTMAGSV